MADVEDTHWPEEPEDEHPERVKLPAGYKSGFDPRRRNLTPFGPPAPPPEELGPPAPPREVLSDDVLDPAVAAAAKEPRVTAPLPVKRGRPKVPLRATRADRVPDPEPPDLMPVKGAAAKVEWARRRLKNLAPTAVRRLEEITEALVPDQGAKCPTCGRGSRRDEETRLRAILAVLDRGGVAPATARQPAADEDHGPALIFPPGTRMAVMVPDRPGAAVTAARRPGLPAAGGEATE